jgi:predicted RNA-binding Zn ribbon-like protein
MAGRDPAPAPLDTIQALVNTIELDVDPAPDALATTTGARDFLRGRHLVGADDPVTDADAARLRDLREALRALLLRNNGVEIGDGAVDVLNRFAGSTALGARFSSDGTLELGGRGAGVDGAIGALLAIVFEAVADGTWGRLKACKDPTCAWAFYDRSRNRSSQWCVMAVCGNRNKARAYRARRKEDDG